MIGTATGKRDDERRAWLAADWLVRECTPALLRAAGLDEHARALEQLRPVTTKLRAEKAGPILDAAWAAAWAAGAAAKGTLEPTVKQIQQSAFALLDRMITLDRC